MAHVVLNNRGLIAAGLNFIVCSPGSSQARPTRIQAVGGNLDHSCTLFVMDKSLTYEVWGL